MLQVVYVPGLGDRRAILQRVVVGLWRFWGLRPYVFRMLWSDKQPYSVKFENLLAKVDELSQQAPVVLIGSSAGASAVLNAYAVRPNSVAAVICIAGKINNPQTISLAYKQESPAFYESAQQVNDSLQKITPTMRSHIMTVRSSADEIIPASDSVIDGATNKVSWTRGHAFTIAWQLIFGLRAFLRFAKQQNQQ